MRRVLVTGAGGFIGQHATPILEARGFEVHAVSSRKQHGNATGATWHSTDLLDPEACHLLMRAVRPSHLLHLAWYTEHGKYWYSPENIAWVQASLALLRSFTEYGGRRAVFAGTCAEYDWAEGFCDEDHTPLQPASVYGACKRALGELLAAHSAATGLSSAWGRIFHLFGPGEKPGRLVPQVITSLLRNTPASCSSGGHWRDFLFVEDAADAFATLLESDLRGALNIARGEPIQIRDLVNAIAGELGKPDLLRFKSSSSTSSDPETLTASVRRLNTELCWSPRTSLGEGLQRTIQWWKNREHA